MGKVDMEAKNYLLHNDRFADVFNYLLYDGNRKIDPDALHPLDAGLIAAPYGSEAREPKQRFRDIFKKWVFMEDGRVVYAVAFGGEAQKKQVITARIRAAFLREPPSVSLYANEPDRSGRLPEESDSPNSFSHSGQIPYRLNHQGTCPL